MKTLYSYTFPSVSILRVALGEIPYVKVGSTSREDFEKRIKEQIGTSNPEDPTIIGSWDVLFDDKDFHQFLRENGVKQLTGPGKEWFEIDPDQLRDMVRTFSEVHALSKPGGKRLPHKRVSGTHNETISDIDFVSFCLRRVLWTKTFYSMRALEKAILDEDEFGIFNSGISSVKCALQPFVREGYMRSSISLQEKHRVFVYRVPVLDTGGYRFCIQCE
jgi:hypothetical protein